MHLPRAVGCVGVVAVLFAGCQETTNHVAPGAGLVTTKRDAVVTGSMNLPLSQHELTTLQDGKVLVSGGFNGSVYVPWSQRYDPATGTFSPTGTMFVGRVGHTATRLLDGRVLVTGGNTGVSSPLASCELYNPATGTWSSVVAMAGARSKHTATLLNDGRVMVVGGELSSNGSAALTSVEVFDPATGRWTTLPPLPQGRTGHRAVLLPNGNVFVVGGGSSSTAVPAYEITPAGVVTARPSPFTPGGRSAHLAFGLPDGRVLITGGSFGGVQANSEIYDPVTQTYALTANTAAPRTLALGAVMPNGSVLIADGFLLFGSPLKTVEVFWPSTNTFSATDPMIWPRVFGAGALLPDGRFLVSGGESSTGGGAMDSAELYSLPVCVPATCGAQACGTTPDGCGGILDCGACGSGQVCTAANTCCTQNTCSMQGATCGTVADGCGSTLNCGTCAGGQICTAAKSCCTPATCPAGACGIISDGCGGTLSCGGCAAGQACIAQACVVCTPVTCSQLGATCGTVFDGCGGTLSCGTCGTGNCSMNQCVAAGTATYDALLKAPRCPPGSSCDSGSLLVGRGPLGPESQAPNTLANSCTDGTAGSFHVDESLDRLKITSLSGGPLQKGAMARIDATVWAYSSFSSDRLDLYYAADSSAPLWTWVTTLNATNSGQNVLSHTFQIPLGGSSTRPAIRGRFRFGGTQAFCDTGSYNDTDDLVFDTGLSSDTTAPTISVDVPWSGAILSGPQSIQVTTSDAVGVVSVQYYAGNTYLGAKGPPYFSPAHFFWNSTVLADGPANVVAKAFDRAGNWSVSLAKPVTIDNTPPAVSFTSPSSGAVLRGNVLLTANASDANGITSVAFLRDGVVINTDTTAPFEFNWASTSTTDGTHTLQARATDSASITTFTPAVTVTVDNAAPAVTISSPSEGELVHGAVTVTAGITDLSAITRVEFFDGASSLGVLTSAPWSLSWNTVFAGEGAHQLTALATDAAGNSATSASRNVQVNNSPLVTISAPVANGTVSGLAAIAVDATALDGRAVTQVDVWVDGALVATLNASPFAFAWNSRTVANGAHVVTARAIDSASFTRTTSAIAFNTANDFTPPQVAITSPAAGAITRGDVSLAAAATDDQGVAQVDFFVDGVFVGSSTSSPFGFTWSSAAATNGNHTVLARAIDTSANATDSQLVTFVVDNQAPTTAMTSPAPGAIARGQLTLSANATDDQGVAQVDFFLDGTLVGSSTASPFSVSWDSATATDGNHTVAARATDLAGNTTDSALVTFSIDNALPETSVTSPASNAWVTGLVSITASAADNGSVQRVEFYDGANLISTDLTPPYQASWSTAGLTGAHVLTSRAFDAAGNSVTSAGVTVNIIVAQLAAYSAVNQAPRCSTPSLSCDTGTLVVGRGPLGPEPAAPNTIGGSCADGTAGTFHGSGESLDRLVIESVAGGPLSPGAQVRVKATIWARNSNDRLDIWRAANADSPTWVLVGTLTPTVFDAASTLQTTFTLPAGSLQAVRGSLRRNGSAVACPSGTNNDRDDLIFVTQ